MSSPATMCPRPRRRAGTPRSASVLATRQRRRRRPPATACLAPATWALAPWPPPRAPGPVRRRDPVASARSKPDRRRAAAPSASTTGRLGVGRSCAPRQGWARGQHPHTRTRRRDVLQAVEADPAGAHESGDLVGRTRVHAGHDVDQHFRTAKACLLALGHERRIAPPGTHPPAPAARPGGTSAQVAYQRRQGVVAVRRPIAVTVPAGVHRYSGPSCTGQPGTRRPPRVPGLASPVQQQDQALDVGRLPAVGSQSNTTTMSGW